MTASRRILCTFFAIAFCTAHTALAFTVAEMKGMEAKVKALVTKNTPSVVALVGTKVPGSGSGTIVTEDGLILRMSREAWDRVLATNLTGVFLLTQAVIKGMVRKRYGRIVNVTSVVGLMGNAGQANYAASKAGLVGLTMSVARELASRNITCNAVAPGFIATAMTDRMTDAAREGLSGQIPLERLGTPDDVAAAVAFLASDEASYVTGTVVNVSGGLYM